MSICWDQDTACGKACGLPSQVEAEEETEVEGTPSNTCDLCINGVTTAAKLITDTGCTQLSKKQIRGVCKQIGAEKHQLSRRNATRLSLNTALVSKSLSLMEPLRLLNFARTWVTASDLKNSHKNSHSYIK